ncbi:MAG: formimidoylglutamase [Vicingaceae bacterium]
MIWQDYLKPVELEKLFPKREFAPHSMAHLLLDFNAEEIAEYDLVLFDVKEDRASSNAGAAEGGMKMRQFLYPYFREEKNLRVADLGTIMPGAEVSDTYFAVEECVDFFLKNGVIPIVIGGSQDLNFALYRAYAKQEQLVNLVSIDASFRLGESDGKINATNYLSKILLQQPSVLFNYSNLGYQSYLVDPQAFDLLDDLFYDIHRLGTLKSDLRFAEPVIRNADFISFSMSAIAQPFSPGNSNVSPNGFTGEEACQLARYAGINDKLSCIGFYDMNPSRDVNGMSAQLLAQMVWYFIDGYYQRKKDFPACNKKDYLKYTVAIDEAKQELVFYKSPKSDRWWVEVPYHSNFRKKYERHLMLPCNYEDYQTAMENEIPERWFKTFQKLK